MSDFPIAASVQKEAHALRPMRIGKDGDAIHYTATTFPDGPYRCCEMTVRRMEATGLLLAPEPGPLKGDLFVDILDSEGDILNTIGVTRAGFEYMRRVLRFKRERDLFELIDAATGQPGDAT